jgi:2-methylisocitrate lyase-like PEP mutase family enzyme
MKKIAEILSRHEKAKRFYDLHHNSKLLILPNIWDSLGALLLEDMGYSAVATASASIAFANGYDDGENISFNQLLAILKRIAEKVNIPVTADIESGYANDEQQLKQNIQQIIEAGIVGINIEDTDKKTNTLLPVEVQCKKIKLIKKVSEEMNVPLFINARTDVYLRSGDNAAANKLEETIKRGFAYKDAGADCFYPITMNNAGDISSTIQQLQMPVNIIIMPGIPELMDLQKMGVARVSLGPGFLKYAIKAMKNLAEKLKSHAGMNDIIENEITSAYIKKLVQ